MAERAPTYSRDVLDVMPASRNYSSPLELVRPTSREGSVGEMSPLGNAREDNSQSALLSSAGDERHPVLRSHRPAVAVREKALDVGEESSRAQAARNPEQVAVGGLEASWVSNDELDDDSRFQVSDAEKQAIRAKISAE